jgi:hypothetical protein
VCVFITAGPNIKMCAGGGMGTVKDMCYEVRRAEAVCVFITAVPVCVYYCSIYQKAVRVRGGGNITFIM